MLGPQHGVFEENLRSRSVKVPPSRARQRRIYAVTHEGVDKLQSVSDWPQEGVSEERVAGVKRIGNQRAEVGEGEALAKNGRHFDRALVIRRKEIGPREHDALNRARQPAV